MFARSNRRRFLQGLGGASLALPALEYFADSKAKAAEGAPKRFVYMFAGTSTGRRIAWNDTESADMLVPDAVGPGYDTKRALQPLTDFGVTSDVSVVTDMLLPWGQTGDIPAGGRHVGFHASSLCPLICGTRSYNDGDNEGATSASVDQIVADQIAEDTPHSVLAYRVQAAYYRGNNGQGGNRGRITYREGGSGIEAIDPIVSPRLAFESLFGGFVPPDPMAAAAALKDLDMRRSALDVTHAASKRLMAKMGMADRHRLERHLEEVDSLQKRLAELELPTEGACVLPTDPGDDPAIGGANENTTEGYSQTAGYSNEDLRAEILCDLVHMAFACDLSRVSSIMMTMAQCFMNMFQLYGHQTDFHEAGHGEAGFGAGLERLSDGCAWHVKHYARLVEKLRDTIDFDGSSLLDNSALVLMFEGGHGFDPQTGNEGVPHSTENMAALIAGRAGGLNASGGQHIPAPGAHPVQVVNSAMKAVGVDQDLGEVAGTVPELFS